MLNKPSPGARPLQRLVMWLRGQTEAQRAARNLEKCGCCCWCPACNDPLNDAATWKPLDEYGHGNYLCGKCGHVSEWHFGLAPCPLLLPLPHNKLAELRPSGKDSNE